MNNSTAMAGGAMTDKSPAAHKYHEMEARRGEHVTLPYATPQQIVRMGQVPRIPSTTGVSAIVPFPYTIVDTRTLGSSARVRE